MKKPNTRTIDYATLIQDNILTIDDVPTDIKQNVTDLLRYFAGISDDDSKKEDVKNA